MVLYPLIFVFGLIVGSFLNAVIYRLRSGESILKTRSHCAKCGHVLAWYELVPIVSFAIQRGRCRECRGSISWQYPAVEIATALMFLVIFNFSPYGGSLSLREIFTTEGGQFSIFKLGYLLVIVSLLIIIFVYDLRHYIIPDKVIHSAIIIVLLYNLIENSGTLYEPLASAFVGALVFASIFVLSRGRWLGFGDVKLVFFMGLFLGWPAIIPAIFLGFLLGGIMGIALIITHRKTMKSQIPFGPFLVAGTFIAMFWGLDIVNWYKGFLL